MNPAGEWKRVEQVVEAVKKMTRREIEERAFPMFQKYMKELSK